MNKTVIDKCQLLVKNRDILQQFFKWENANMILTGSSFYTSIEKEADLENLKKCKQILKDNSKVLSEYRGNVMIPLLCKMDSVENPTEYFKKVESLVGMMKHFKWMNPSYKVLAAMTIIDNIGENPSSEIIDRMTVLYEGMKKNHPWLTSDEDLPFAAMLAVSELDTKALIEEMESCYKLLLNDFKDKNPVQSLSHVLAVDSTDTQDKCKKIVEIFELMKAKKHKYSTGYELAVLGTMSMLDVSVEQIVEEFIEADNYLKDCKGFGDFIMGKKTRRMYAALMVMDAHMPPASKSQEALVASTLSIVIAMQICMIIIMSSVIASSVN